MFCGFCFCFAILEGCENCITQFIALILKLCNRRTLFILRLSVECLHSSSCPTAITRFVVIVWFYPVKCVAWRSFAHIRQKVLKTIPPPSAYSHVCTTVVFVTWVLLVIATIFHILPRPIRPAFTVVVCCCALIAVVPTCWDFPSSYKLTVVLSAVSLRMSRTFTLLVDAWLHNDSLLRLRFTAWHHLWPGGCSQYVGGYVFAGLVLWPTQVSRCRPGALHLD